MQKSFKCQFWVLLVMALLCGVVSVPAQEGNTAAELKKLQEQFEVELIILNKPLAMLQDKYRGYLTKQKADFQAAGQLKAMLAVDGELQALESGIDAALSDVPELKRLQEIYRSQRGTVQANGAKNKLSIIQSFQKSAADLATRLTKEGKIEDAKLALAVADRYEALSRDPAFVKYPGSTAFNGHYYKLLPEVSTWHEAQKLCKQMGGDLAMPASDEENTFLAEMAKATKLNALWLGATDEKREGVWVWKGSQINYSNWDTKANQPNNADRVEHYPVINSFATGRWWDFPTDPVAYPGLTGKRIPGAICQWE